MLYGCAAETEFQSPPSVTIAKPGDACAHPLVNAMQVTGRVSPSFGCACKTAPIHCVDRRCPLGGYTDEIALNPAHFKGRSQREVFSTLVHEMVHLEQHHFGHPSRAGYHNREWVHWMERVGLIPSATGEPGGRQLGNK